MILSRYPKIQSIWDLGGRFFNNPFDKKFITLDQKKVSLDYIEHTILRPVFKDPRVHFAVNCASKSCPPLLSKPYRGKTLDDQLEAATRDFINDPRQNHIRGDTLYISKIFKWFSEDFDNDPVSFIMSYASENFTSQTTQNQTTKNQTTKNQIIKHQTNTPERLRVKYLDYDGSLNGK